MAALYGAADMSRLLRRSDALLAPAPLAPFAPANRDVDPPGALRAFRNEVVDIDELFEPPNINCPEKYIELDQSHTENKRASYLRRAPGP